MGRVKHNDSSPLVNPHILRDKRVMLVRDLDVETVLACMKPFLGENIFNMINVESTCADRANLLIDHLQSVSAEEYGAFNAFLKIIGGTQPGLFHALVGRVPDEMESDFCVQDYAQTLKGVIQDQGHQTDSPFDEKIEFDSEFVQLAIVRDKTDPEIFETLPHLVQSLPSTNEDREDFVPAEKLLNDDDTHKKIKHVSLYGRAGTGKTATFQWLAREWSFNRWAPQFTLLFLLQLRMLSVSDQHMTGIELLTLTSIYQVTEVGLIMFLVSWLQNGVDRVLVFIDGLDEVAGFATRLKTCPRISDLNVKAHPIDLCLNILQGNLLAGATIISASRSFDGLDALPFDKKFEILGLTESRVDEFVTQKHPSKAAHIMSVLTNSPLLMSVCSITFYCALISRLLAEGVIFQTEELETYTRLMAFLIVQCVQRNQSEWSFEIQVAPYFHKLAHLAYMGIFERQLKGQMSKLVFNDHDLKRNGLTVQDLILIQGSGLLHLQKIKDGLRLTVTAEFRHIFVQEMLASAYLLFSCPYVGDVFRSLQLTGQFNMATLYLFGLHNDVTSEWITAIRAVASPARHETTYPVNSQLDEFIDGLCQEKGVKTSNAKLQICLLLHEGQMAQKAKSTSKHIIQNGELCIEQTPLTIIDLMALRFVCQYADSVTEISMKTCRLTDTAIKYLTSSMLKDHAETLHTLQLEHNLIGDDGAQVIAKWIQHSQTQQTSDTGANIRVESGTKSIANALVSFNSPTLDTSGSDSDTGGTKTIAKTLFSNDGLQTLGISSNQIGSVGATAIATALVSNTSLQTLDISSNHIGSDGAISIATALVSNTSLQTLNISSNHIGSDGAIPIATALVSNTSLQTLDISSNHIGSDGAIPIATALVSNTNLQTLDISSNHIGSDGAIPIATALVSNTNLQTLDISSNHIGSDGAIPIATALVSNTNLQTLDISSNHIGSDGAIPIATALVSNTNLQTLDISSNHIGSDGAIRIATALVSNTSLQTLDISSNHIGSDGAIAIAEALASCNILQILGIGANNIGTAGTLAIAKALVHNTNLQTLDISSNHVGSEGGEALVKALNENPGIQRLNMKNNDIDESTFKALTAALEALRIDPSHDVDHQVRVRYLSGIPSDRETQAPVRHNEDAFSFSQQFTSEGGVLQHPESDVVLTVPPGAVPDGERFAVHVRVNVNLQDYITEMQRVDGCIISPVVECLINRKQYFKKPVTISLPLCRIPKTPADIKVLFSEGNGFQNILSDQQMSYDVNNNMVHIHTPHFTKFLVMGEETVEVADLLLSLGASMSVSRFRSTAELRLMAHINCHGLKDFRRQRKMDLPPNMDEIYTLRVCLPQRNTPVDFPTIHIDLQIEDKYEWNIKHHQKKVSKTVDGSKVLHKEKIGYHMSKTVATFMLESEEKWEDVSFTMNVKFQYGQDIEDDEYPFGLIYPMTKRKRPKVCHTEENYNNEPPIWSMRSPGALELLKDTADGDRIKPILPELISAVELDDDVWTELKRLGVVRVTQENRFKLNSTREATTERFLEYLRIGPAWKFHAFLRALALVNDDGVIQMLGYHVLFYSVPDNGHDQHQPASQPLTQPSQPPVWSFSHPGAMELLQGTSDDACITAKLTELVQVVELDDLWPELKRLDVVSESTRNELTHNSTREDTTLAFLLYLKRGPVWKYHAFLRVLAIVQDHHVIHMLGKQVQQYTS